MIVGCYSLHLYCDFHDAASDLDAHLYPAEFTGKSETGCFREASAAGWKIYPAQRKARCPRCVSKVYSKKELV